MKLAVSRMIYFTNKMKIMTEFYRDKLGLASIDSPISNLMNFSNSMQAVAPLPSTKALQANLHHATKSSSIPMTWAKRVKNS